MALISKTRNCLLSGDGLQFHIKEFFSLMVSILYTSEGIDSIFKRAEENEIVL